MNIRATVKFVVGSVLLFNLVLIALMNRQQDWQQSQTWETYLSYPAIDNVDRCSSWTSTQATIGDFQIPWKKQDRRVLSDYSDSRLTRIVLNAYNTVTEDIEELVDLYYVVDLNWHFKHRIGTSFLCEGQRYNHVPGLDFLNEKTSLIQALSAQPVVQPSPLLESYRLDEYEECAVFLQKVAAEKAGWMVRKSKFSSTPRDYTLITPETYANFLGRTRCPVLGSIGQRVLERPLLFYGKKFEIRAYMLVANVDPLMVLFHNGYVRVSAAAYNTTDLDSQLTYLSEGSGLSRQEIKQRSPSYKELSSFFVDYMQFSHNWFDSVKDQMKEIMKQLVETGSQLIVKHPGVFELVAVDFVIDEDSRVWLLETSLSPAISAMTEHRRKLHTSMLTTLIDLEFALLYQGDFDGLLQQSSFEWIIDQRK